jgi:hypothetical protein
MRQPVPVDVPTIGDRRSNELHQSNDLTDAVRVLRIQEMAERQRQMTSTETAIVKQMCQVCGISCG